MEHTDLNIIMFSEFLDRIHYGLTIATTTKALDRNVTIFFPMKSIKILAKKKLKFEYDKMITENGEPGNKYMSDLQNKKIVSIDDLLDFSINLDVRFMVCEMGMQYLGLNKSDLIEKLNITEGGLTYFLNQSYTNKSTLIFI